LLIKNIHEGQVGKCLTEYQK